MTLLLNIAHTRNFISQIHEYGLIILKLKHVKCKKQADFETALNQCFTESRIF